MLPTLGGQAGLNLAMELEEAGFCLQGAGLLGTTARTIKKAEDRLEFKETMEKSASPVAASPGGGKCRGRRGICRKIGYPVVLRPAYTLGGLGRRYRPYNRDRTGGNTENGLRFPA